MTVIESALEDVKREVEKQIAEPPPLGGPNANLATEPSPVRSVGPRAGMQSVAPGQALGDDFLQLRVPPSEGWVRIGETAGAVNLARQGSESRESFAAQVMLFSVKPGSGSQELMTQVRNKVESDNPSGRFAVVTSEFESTNKRGYPCVRHRGTYEDKQAMTGPASSETLMLQVVALYCQHPQQDVTGFAAIYSRRGMAVRTAFESEAEGFLNGVRAGKDAHPSVTGDGAPRDGAASLN